MNQDKEFVSSSFGIRNEKDLAHIFNVLRNKMYADKILATIREYSTNAQDAHIESSQANRPIEIELPKIGIHGRSSFKVRDYGAGLSDDQIRNIYTMYGASTKRESKETNGQLGFGAKAAFSYTDSFEIISFHNGIKTTYEAFIDESGLGTIAEVSSIPSNDPSGVLIQVKVQPSDVGVFRQRAADFYKNFNPTPIFKDDTGFKVSKTKYSLKTSDFGIKADNTFGDSVKLIMGNVAYPLNPTIISELFKEPAQVQAVNKIFSNNLIDLFIPVGDASIAASREALEYDTMTKRAIKNKFDILIGHFQSAVKTREANIKDILDAHNLLNDLDDSSKMENVFLPLMADNHKNGKPCVNFNGRKVQEVTFETPESTHRVESNYSTTAKNAAGEEVITTHVQVDTVKDFLLRKIIENKNTKNGVRCIEERESWTFDKDDIIFYGKKTDKYLQRLKTCLDNKKNTGKIYYLDIVNPEENIDTFKEYTEIPNKYFVDISTIKPTQIERKKREASPLLNIYRAKFLKIKSNAKNSSTEALEPVTIEPNKKYTYVYLPDGRYNSIRFLSTEFATYFNSVTGINTNFERLNTISLKDLIEELTKNNPSLKEKIGQIVLVKEKSVEDIPGNWESLFSVLLDEYRDIGITVDSRDSIYNLCRDLSGTMCIDLGNISKGAESLFTKAKELSNEKNQLVNEVNNWSNKIQAEFRESIYYRAPYPTSNFFSDIKRFLKSNTPTTIKTDLYTTKINNLKKRIINTNNEIAKTYPLLSYFVVGYSQLPAVLEYIDLIDNKNTK